MSIDNNSSDGNSQSDKKFIPFGYLKLSRQIVNSKLWREDDFTLRLAILLLCKARFQDEPVSVQGWPDMILGKGELTVTEKGLANEVNKCRTRKRISRDKIHRTLLKLEAHGFLHRETHNRFTKVTICNYEAYQNQDSYKRTVNRTTNRALYNNGIKTSSNSGAKQNQIPNLNLIDEPI